MINRCKQAIKNMRRFRIRHSYTYCHKNETSKNEELPAKALSLKSLENSLIPLLFP